MIVRFDGRLGNQIFQYAFFLRLKEMFPNFDVTMDNHDLKKDWIYIADVFEVNIPICSIREHNKNIRNIRFLPTRITSKMGYPRFSKDVKKELEIDGRNIRTESNNIDENSFFMGYWQSENHFIEVKDKVLENLSFKKLEDDNNKKMAATIMSCNSISIHIRRTDYMNAENKGHFMCLCDTNYYKNAIKHLQNTEIDPVFFVFSDDIPWCKKYMHSDGFVYVDINHGSDSWKDMYLMSKCKINIVANSSFSWWGAYLNRNKSVIAPDYIGEHEKYFPDYYPPSWKRIGIH